MWSLSATFSCAAAPGRKQAKTNHVERVEAAHQTRLDAGDKKFDKLSADMAQLLKVQNALLMHEITGNGIEKLKTVKSELDTYLATRN